MSISTFIANSTYRPSLSRNDNVIAEDYRNALLLSTRPLSGPGTITINTSRDEAGSLHDSFTITFFAKELGSSAISVAVDNVSYKCTYGDQVALYSLVADQGPVRHPEAFSPQTVFVKAAREKPWLSVFTC
jgi:hypothetical protein